QEELGGSRRLAGPRGARRCRGRRGPARRLARARGPPGRGVRADVDARRPRGVAPEARPRAQGHGHPAARSRRGARPPRLAAAHGAARAPRAARGPARGGRLRRSPMTTEVRPSAEGRAPLRLTMAAPRRGKPPRHFADLTRDERVAALGELGEKPFRAAQLAHHYFGRLTDDAADMTDLPAARRDDVVGALFPRLLAPVRTLTADRGTTVKTLWS